MVIEQRGKFSLRARAQRVIASTQFLLSADGLSSKIEINKFNSLFSSTDFFEFINRCFEIQLQIVFDILNKISCSKNKDFSFADLAEWILTKMVKIWTTRGNFQIDSVLTGHLKNIVQLFLTNTDVETRQVDCLCEILLKANLDWLLNDVLKD